MNKATQHFIFLLLLFFHIAQGQNSSSLQKENIINFNKPDSLPKQVYDLLSSNKLIMIGEMHGTKEPAAFVTGLAQLFAFNGDSVQVGFEIPSDQMNEFLKLKTDNSIYSSIFFSQGLDDGRSSNAWATAISTLNNNPSVHIFFYDINTNESKTDDDRDSLMYLKIKSNLQAHPKWKTITLSGNIHNMLQPRNGKNKTAAYLYNDTELNLRNKLCSLNHNYQSGTMLNKIGKELKLRPVNMGESLYSKLTNSDNFLYIYKNEPTNTYSGIFFTKTVTAATLTNK